MKWKEVIQINELIEKRSNSKMGVCILINQGEYMHLCGALQEERRTHLRAVSQNVLQENGVRCHYTKSYQKLPAAISLVSF